MIRASLVRSALVAAVALGTRTAGAERWMEYLTRGVVAVHQGEGMVYVGWRWLGTDPDGIAFNVYRSTGGGAPVKLNSEPITASTNFVDQGMELAQPNAYFVTPVLDNREQAASAPFVLPAHAPARQYLEVPLKTPAGYTPGDTSAGDLDGDGEYDLVWSRRGGRPSQRHPGKSAAFAGVHALACLFWAGMARVAR